MKNKTIWFFHPYATPPTLSGLTRPFNFGEYLLESGYEVKIFSSSYLHYSDINLITDGKLYLENNDTEVPFLFVRTIGGTGNGVNRILNMISYYLNLFKVVKKIIKQGDKPDIVIGSSPHPLAMIAAIKISKKLKIPCINEVRDFWPEVFFMGDRLKESSLIGKILLQGEYWIYRNSDAMIFLKEGDYTYLTDKKWDISNGGKIDLEKCFYINNGVDLKTFDRSSRDDIFEDKDLDSEKFKVVYVGTIRTVNNLDVLLDAAKLLYKYKDIQFLIYGDGDQLKELEKRIEVEEISNVKLKGYVSKKYIPYILSRSTVNILNYSQSKYNWSRGNSSNKLFEYMASGKPIISTVKMGYSPISKHNIGIELEKNNSEELAEAILEIKKLSNLEYSDFNRRSREASKKYDYEVLSVKLMSVIEKTITNKK